MTSDSDSIFLTPSPSRRKLRRSLNVKAKDKVRKSKVELDESFVDIPENNDEEERRVRNLNRVLNVQRETLDSPATPVERRKSFGVGLAGLTNAQLAEHYKNCIKLSSENKITAKNAFELHLIDYMNEAIKTVEGPTNFQMASCTLDASAKIYAFRVDNVHAEAHKMIGGLGIMNDQKKRKASAEDADGNEAQAEEEGQKLQKKRKLKKSNNIEQNVNNLNLSKIEQKYEIDPLFKKISSLSEACGVNSLLYFMQSMDDSCKLMVDSDFVPFAAKETSSLPDAQDIMIDLSDFKDKLESISSSSLEICPTFSNFRFEDADATSKDISEWFGQSQKHDVTFDLDASLEPIEANEAAGDFYNNDGLPDADDDEDDKDVGGCVEMGDAPASALLDKQSLDKAIRLESMSDLTKILLDKPSEYSYFKHNLKAAWAGPEHWKVQLASRAVASDKDKDQAKEGRQTRKTKQNTFVLVYANIDYDIELGCKNLAKSTLQSWMEKKTTYPEDVHYDTKNLSMLFLKPMHIKNVKFKTCEDGTEVITYNYENKNDCLNFCPEVNDDECNQNDSDDDGDNVCNAADPFLPTPNDNADKLNDDGGMPFPSSGAFVGSNLVQQPYKIAKIDINYAHIYKKVDVKKLKQHIWKSLTAKAGSNKNEVAHTVEDKLEGKKSLRTLYEELAPTLPSSVTDKLTIPILFVSLLHLANEKNLKLEGRGDLCNVSITQN